MLCAYIYIYVCIRFDNITISIVCISSSISIAIAITIRINTAITSIRSDMFIIIIIMKVDYYCFVCLYHLCIILYVLFITILYVLS